MDPIPSILDQGIKVIPLESAFHAYNSGSADGKRFCSRAYDPSQKRSRLIWQVRDDQKLTALEPVDVIGKGSFEDARVFQHNGRHYIAYTEGIYERVPFVSMQQISPLGADWQPEDKITIPYGGNGSGKRSEKNWQFFSHEGRLFFVYSIAPHIVVELDADFRPRNEYRTDIPLHWPWGEVLRGGTPPLKVGHNGEFYITFFHSHAAHRQANRRYSMGAYLFESKPPFQVQKISPVLLRASDKDMIVPNPSVPGWNPLVIFPMGAWYGVDGLTVTCGVNDSFDALAKVSGMIWHDVERYAQPKIRYFQAENGPMPVMMNGQAVPWKLRRLKSPFYQPRGYMATSDPNLIALIENRKDTKEISERVFLEYEAGK